MAYTFDPALTNRRDRIRLLLGDTGDGANELQSMTLTGTVTSGTFTATFGSAVTIPYNSTAAQVMAILETASGIGVGNVGVSGVPGQWLVEFKGTLARKDVAQIAVNGAGLTGGSVSSQTVQEGRAVGEFLLADETIDGMLSKFTYGESLAQLADSLASRFAQEPDRISDSGVSVSWKDRVATWRQLAKDARAGKYIPPTATAVDRGPVIGLIEAPDVTQLR